MSPLAGSWVVISGLISRVSIVITHIRGLIAPLNTTHGPPSTGDRRPVESAGNQCGQRGAFLGLGAKVAVSSLFLGGV